MEISSSNLLDSFSNSYGFSISRNLHSSNVKSLRGKSKMSRFHKKALRRPLSRGMATRRPLSKKKHNDKGEKCQ